MSDDLIRRSDAIGACSYETIECYEARKAIRALPSADRPQEKCEFCKDGGFIGARLILGNDGKWHKINYCPNCGARMKGADDE